MDDDSLVCGALVTIVLLLLLFLAFGFGRSVGFDDKMLESIIQNGCNNRNNP